MTPDQHDPSRTATSAGEKFDDEHYPAYTIGRAADMLGTTQGFLRSLDEAGLIEPARSAGGHRRYSRSQLRLAARVRELLDEGTALDAACRIVTLENQLHEAQRRNAEQHSTG
jgi:DNA-binding transcriptional MerR regulator